MKTMQNTRHVSDKLVTDRILHSRADSRRQTEGDLETGEGEGMRADDETAAPPTASKPKERPVSVRSKGLNRKMSEVKLVNKKLTFIEFTRVNMRLAEDRILSFLSVFATGRGTRWTRGATFYYVPEVQWCTLLTQRRRWLNGTFCSIIFFLNSPRAFARIRGALFDR